MQVGYSAPGAHRARVAGDTTARLAAEMGVLAFSTAYARWAARETGRHSPRSRTRRYATCRLARQPPAQTQQEPKPDHDVEGQVD